REQLHQPLLQALGAAPERREILVAAGRAGAGRGRLGGAVVTDEAIPVRGGAQAVEHAIRVAVIAAGKPAAGIAGEHRRVAAAVEEDERLLAAAEDLPDRADRLRRQPVGE